MIKALRRSPGFHAALGFAALMVLSLAFGAIVGLYPSQQERCDSMCAKQSLSGRLVPKYSLIQAGGNEARRGPLECKCV